MGEKLPPTDNERGPSLLRLLGALSSLLVGLLLFWRSAGKGGYVPCDAEKRGRNFRQLALIGAAMSLVALLCLATLSGSLVLAPNMQLNARAHPTPLAKPKQLYSMPELPGPVADSLESLYEQQAQELHSYGWVDRERGIVRIPIERAIDLLAREGLPTGPGAANDAGGE